MNFNNPFNILNSSNINDLNFHESIDEKIVEYVTDLRNNEELYHDFNYFIKTRLNDYELSNKMNKSNLSTNYLLTLHGKAKDKKARIRIPKNVYLISLEENGTLWNSTIIGYLRERIKLQNIINESFIKSITIELSLLELFRIKRYLLENNNIDLSIEEIMNNKSYYIQKYFKVYKPNDRIDDFILSSDEKKAFYSGLFKLPTKSYIIYNNEDNNENNNENGWTFVKSKKKSNVNSNVNSKWKIISYHKIKEALFKPKNNENIIKKLLYPNDSNIRVEENDYYTIHLKYLEELKSNEKMRKKLKSMYTLKKNLKINVKNMGNNKRTKLISFKDLLEKIIYKTKPTQNKPCILFCNFCTNKKYPYYPQDSIIKNEDIPPLNENENENKKEKENENENKQENKQDSSIPILYLDYEKYVLNGRISKYNYIKNVNKVLFDLYLCLNIYEKYISKICKKYIRYHYNSTENVLIKDMIKNIKLYVKEITKRNGNKITIKKYENIINDFYKNKNNFHSFINNYNDLINICKTKLHDLFLENDLNTMNELCNDILHETQRIFYQFKKNNIYYNSNKRYFTELSFFYNTFYPFSFIFTGNCTYSYSFIQYLLFIVYSHFRKITKSILYYQNNYNLNENNKSIKNDYIDEIIESYYQNQNEYETISKVINHYDSIIRNVIRDLHKVYTNNNSSFGQSRKQHKFLLADLDNYYDLYLHDENLYNEFQNNVNTNFLISKKKINYPYYNHYNVDEKNNN